MSDTSVRDFELANRAFEQFTLAEREIALRHFASLWYPLITDRFFEAVHRVIYELRTAVAPK